MHVHVASLSPVQLGTFLDPFFSSKNGLLVTVVVFSEPWLQQELPAGSRLSRTHSSASGGSARTLFCAITSATGRDGQARLLGRRVGRKIFCAVVHMCRLSVPMFSCIGSLVQVLRSTCIGFRSRSFCCSGPMRPHHRPKAHQRAEQKHLAL